MNSSDVDQCASGLPGHVLSKIGDGAMKAAELNSHLASGGVVVVSTYTRAVQYAKKHAGWFSEANGNLYVRHGNGKNQLSIGDVLLVKVQMGTFK